MNTYRVIYILSALILLIVHAGYGEAASDGSGLDALIEEAMQNNPELKAYGERIQAFEQRPSQARALEDPMLGIAVLNLPVDTFAFDQEAMTQKQVSVRQKLPFPGKLDLRGKLAERDLEVARQEYEGKKNSILMMVKSAYFDLIFVEKAIEITNYNKELVTDLIETAETEYTVGKTGQRDIVRVQLELSGIIKQLITLEQQKAVIEARLTSLLNRSVHRPFAAGEPEQTPFALPADTLDRMAETSSPALLSLDHLIKKSDRAVMLAKKEYYPDFELGVSYGQRDDAELAERPDFISAAVTVNIPLWYKSRESRKVSEEIANKRAAEARYNAMKNEIYFQITQIVSEIGRYDREIDLLRTGMIPQSTLSYESAIGAYRVNRTGLMTAIRNQIELYNFELDYYRTITAREKKLAELEATVGKALF